MHVSSPYPYYDVGFRIIKWNNEGEINWEVEEGYLMGSHFSFWKISSHIITWKNFISSIILGKDYDVQLDFSLKRGEDEVIYCNWELNKWGGEREDRAKFFSKELFLLNYFNLIHFFFLHFLGNVSIIENGAWCHNLMLITNRFDKEGMRTI